MTREEKQKAIDALKISAPVMAVTQEEFKDYIQTLNKVMDLLEQEPCEDAVSREAVLDLIADYDLSMGQVVRGIHALPSVTPQESQTFRWCTNCREYDQEKHCCHRWSKVIRDTVDEMKQEYIEREVLDKIRSEIERQERWLMDAGYNQYNVDIALDAIKLEVNKYKAENNS